MKKSTPLIFISSLFFFFFPVLVSFGLTIKNPIASDDVGAVIKSIWQFVYYFAIAVVPLMAIIAAFMFMTAGGSPEKIKKARDLLLWLAVGVIIVLLAGGIVNLIRKIMGV